MEIIISHRFVDRYLYFHSGFDIFKSHEAADSKLTHQRCDRILNLIDVSSTFIVFAKHSAADLIGVCDAACHGFYNLGYMLHIAD